MPAYDIVVPVDLGNGKRFTVRANLEPEETSTLTCPNCEEDVPLDVRRIDLDTVAVCTEGGRAISIDSAEAKEAIGRAEDSLDRNDGNTCPHCGCRC